MLRGPVRGARHLSEPMGAEQERAGRVKPIRDKRGGTETPERGVPPSAGLSQSEPSGAGLGAGSGRSRGRKHRTLPVSLSAALALVPAPTLLTGRADAGSEGDGERGGTWSARHGLSGIRRRGECCSLRAAAALRGAAPLLAVPRDRGHLRPLDLRRLLRCLLCPQSEPWSPRRVRV